MLLVGLTSFLAPSRVSSSARSPRLMAFGGHSPSMRLGLQDHDSASLFPGTARRVGSGYSNTRVSDSGSFVLVGVALVVVGFALV